MQLRRARWSKWSVVTGFFSLLKRRAFSLLFPVCAHSCIISYNDAYWSQLANNAACLVLECLNNFIQWFRVRREGRIGGRGDFKRDDCDSSRMGKYFHVAFYIFRVYHLTFFSFFLALGHFTSEIFPFKTAELTIGVCAPLIVSSKYCKRGQLQPFYHQHWHM